MTYQNTEKKIESCQVQRRTYPTKAEFHEFKVEGNRHLLESNTLKTWLVKTDEDVDKIKQGIGEVSKPIFPAYLPPSKFESVTLQLTRACNMACSYCFVKNYYDPKQDMLSLDVVKQFAEQHLKSDYTAVSFFGGEPTLCMDRMEEIRQYCSTRSPHIRFNVTTNGTLLDKPACGFPSVAEYLSAHKFGGIVSIDGPPEVHDKYRTYAGGKGTFADILRNLENLKDTSYVKVVTLRGTFTTEIVKSEVSLKERLQFLNELMYRGIGQHVSLEPVVLSEASCISGDKELTIMNQDDVFAALEKQYMDATKWFAEEVNQGRKPHWHQVVKMLERMYFRRPAFQECGAGKGYCSLDVDGTICACHRTQFTSIGNIRDGIDEAERAKWAESRGYVRRGCNECPVRYICGSGCKEASLLYYRDICRPVDVECKFRMLWIKCAFYLLANCDVKRILSVPQKQNTGNARQG